jgi:hypothetical protein
MTMPANLTLGKLPFVPDPQDHPVSRYLAAVPLPAAYRCPVKAPVLNQGTAPQCVAYSGVLGRTITEQPEAHELVAFDAGDLFRLAGGGPNGAEIRNAAAALLKTGALATSTARKGERLKIASYALCRTVFEAKTAVYARGWAWLGVDWRNSWFRPHGDGTLPYPDSVAGGHAISIIGWDDAHTVPNGTPGALLIQNSWGPKWGVAGTCWLPYAYLDASLECFVTIDAPDPAGPVIAITPFAAPRLVTVHRGPLTGYRTGQTKSHLWLRDSHCHADAAVTVTAPYSGTKPPRGEFVRIMDGFYAGYWVLTSKVTLS